MTRPYPEELVEIMEEAGTRYDRWLHRPGVRGQMVMPQDGLEYWVAQVTWERAIDEAAKEFMMTLDEAKAIVADAERS